MQPDTCPLYEWKNINSTCVLHKMTKRLKADSHQVELCNNRILNISYSKVNF